MKQNRQLGFQMIYLIACAINNDLPDSEIVSKIDFDSLYNLAQFHSVTAIVAMSLEKVWDSIPNPNEETINKWKQAKEKSIRKNILLDTEREQILSYMENKGIWYVPLKGIILKELYPRYGMRQMSDNDILYDSAYQKDLYNFMKSRGYKAEIYNRGNHDAYIKPPVYNYEMHTSLFCSSQDKQLDLYYSNIKEKLLPDESKKYGYHLSPEDFYIYVTAHSYKHYKSGGTGIRSLIDCFVFWQKYNSELNVPYIDSELQKIGILDFEKMCRNLANKLFSDTNTLRESNFSSSELKYLDSFILFGTYGTFENRVKEEFRTLQNNSDSKKSAKFRYYWNRIFMTSDRLKDFYPFFYRHKILLPALWVFRIFKALLFGRERIKTEIAVVNIECKK